MVAKIPQSIKIKVLNEWLQGSSRNKIARDNGIGEGTVTAILQQTRNNDIPDRPNEEACLNVKKRRSLCK